MSCDRRHAVRWGRALRVLSGGDPLVLLYRPLSLVTRALAAGITLVVVLPQIRRMREEALPE